MKPDKKQLPQLIALGVLVLICVGYVSFQVMGGSGSRKTKKTHARSEAGVIVDVASEAASQTPDLAVQSLFPGLGSVPSRRDPFATQPLPGMIQADGAKAAAQKFRKSFNSRMMSMNRVPRIDVKPINPFAGLGPDGPESSVPKPTSEPQFTLTGVVRGAENVAIIRSAQGGRYVVKQGQLIEGRYRVVLVTGDAVVLADGYRRMYVRLGGVQNAS